MRVMLVILVAETKLRFSQLFACEGVVFTKVCVVQSCISVHVIACMILNLIWLDSQKNDLS
jgi:hypothetical protein